jgi:6-phosphofructokinase 1
MNACVRAVVRAADCHGIEVAGILRGYQGLLDRQFFGASSTGAVPLMTVRSVSGWSRYGGAFLFCSRSDEFKTPEGQEKAIASLRDHGIDALVAIGGDGTFRGCMALAERWDGPIIGCPGTIDNDLPGTDYTIGFSTAVQTGVEALDKLRDTAHSHNRMFLIEVMGRHSGYLAVHTALAGGAEVVAIPETKTDIHDIIRTLERLKASGKESIMMVVAEGDEEGGAAILNDQLVRHGCPFRTRIVVLGHLQRGGTPTPEDRYRATRMGYDAVQAIVNGETGKMAGLRGDDSVLVPFEKCCSRHNEIPRYLLDLLEVVGN